MRRTLHLGINFSRLVFYALASLALALPAGAASVYWDGPNTAADGVVDGGSGTWDTSTLNWTTATGSPNVTWANANNDTAVFTNAAGTVTLGAPITANGLAIRGNYTITNGGNNLTLNGAGITISGNNSNTATLGGTGAILLGASQTWSNNIKTMTIACPVNTGTNLLTLETRDNALDVTGKISGAGGLAIRSSQSSGANADNTGNPTLNNANDYTGATTLTGGYIWLNSGGLEALGVDPSDIILTNGGFRLTGTGTVTRGLTLAGTCGVSKTAGTTTFNGRLTGFGGFSVSGSFGGGGVVVLGASNDFAGDFTLLTDVTVRLANVNALSRATITGLDAARSSLDCTNSNFSYVLGGLKGAGNLNLGTGLGGGGSGVAFIGNNNQTNTYSGSLSGSAGFTKIGAGQQTFTGPSTYTGPTLISAGTLSLGATGSLSNTPSITLAASTVFDVSAVTGGFSLATNQALKGAGAVKGAVASSGQVSPGVNGVGALSLDTSYTQTSGGVLNFAPQSATNTPTLLVGGAANLNGTLNVTLTNGYAPTLGDSLVVLTAANLNGSFAVTNLPALNNGLAFKMSTNSGSVVLMVISLSPGLVVLPSAYDFGNVVTGTVAQATLVISNNGTSTLTGTAAVAGAPFAIVSGGSYSVSPASATNLVVSFAPATTGTFHDAVVFACNGGGATNALLAGAGALPATLVVNPSSFNFGGVFTGLTAQATFIVTNPGVSALTGTAAVAGAPFALVSGGTYSVSARSSTNVVVSFAPTLGGGFAGAVFFASNGGNATNALAGTGLTAPPPDASVAYGFNCLPNMPGDSGTTGATSLGLGSTLKQTFIPRTDAFLSAFNLQDSNGIHAVALSAVSLYLYGYQSNPSTFNVAISRVETNGSRTLLCGQNFLQSVWGWTVRTWAFSNACLVNFDAPYELAVTLVQGDGAVSLFTTASDYPDGACSAGGDLWFGLSGSATLPVYTAVTITANATNAYFYDASTNMDFTSYDNLKGKFLGVSGHPEQLGFNCPPTWPSLTFVLADTNLATLQAQGGGGGSSATLNGLAEGETFLFAKSGANVVAYLKLQPHPRRTMNLSYTYVAYPGEINSWLFASFPGVSSHISAVYAQANIGVNWTDNGVLNFNWDLNGDGSSYTAAYDEVWSPMTYGVLPNMPKFFSNVYALRDVTNNTTSGGSNGGGTSMGLGVPSNPPRGATIRANLLSRTPDSMGSTLAHEVGHNLGLYHVGVGTDATDNLMDVGRYADNLWSWQWAIIHNTLAVLYDVPPAVALTAPTNGASFIAPAALNLSASILTNRNPISAVQFFSSGTNLLATATNSPYTCAWTNVSAGNYALTAVVSDNQWMISTSTVVNITVTTLPPTPPTILPGVYVAGGAFNFQFAGLQGQHYRVEYTPALPATSPWQVVTDILSLATSPFAASIPATNGAGFYRVGWIP